MDFMVIQIKHLLLFLVSKMDLYFNLFVFFLMISSIARKRETWINLETGINLDNCCLIFLPKKICAVLWSQCSTTSNATFFRKETQLMRYSWLRTALYGAATTVIIMVKELLQPRDRLNVLKKVSSLEKNFLIGFGVKIPLSTCPISSSPFLQKPSKPIQKWKPLL